MCWFEQISCRGRGWGRCGEFGPGGGSICDSSDIALSPLVISDSSSSAGAGCYGTNLAEALSVHLYPIALLIERVRRDGVHLLLKSCSYREAYAKWWIRMLFYNLESSDLPSPLGVKAHSTQGMSAPKAFLVLQCCRVVYAPHIRQVLDNDLRATPGSSVLLP